VRADFSKPVYAARARIGLPMPLLQPSLEATMQHPADDATNLSPSHLPLSHPFCCTVIIFSGQWAVWC